MISERPQYWTINFATRQTTPRQHECIGTYRVLRRSFGGFGGRQLFPQLALLPGLMRCVWCCSGTFFLLRFRITVGRKPTNIADNFDVDHGTITVHADSTYAPPPKVPKMPEFYLFSMLEFHFCFPCSNFTYFHGKLPWMVIEVRSLARGEESHLPPGEKGYDRVPRAL